MATRVTRSASPTITAGMTRGKYTANRPEKIRAVSDRTMMISTRKMTRAAFRLVMNCRGRSSLRSQAANRAWAGAAEGVVVIGVSVTVSRLLVPPRGQGQRDGLVQRHGLSRRKGRIERLVA